MSYRIALENGRIADARIDVTGRSVVLHSRGGATGGRPPRNQGYAEALIAICRKASARPANLVRVLIDSTVARRSPEAARILVAQDEIGQLSGDELARNIRVRMRRFGQSEGTVGGNSTKQVRFDFDLASPAIFALLGLRPAAQSQASNAAAPAIRRLSAAQLQRVSPLHIRHAVDLLLAGKDAPNFAQSRDYDVVVPGGPRLAPKKVFGLAIGQALGIEAFPGHFTAGLGQPCFDLIEQAGYRIVAKGDGLQSVGANDDPLPPDADELSWAEGSPGLERHLRGERRRDSRAVAAKRASVRAVHHGRLACENDACDADWYAIFPLAIAEAVFEIHHTRLMSTMEDGHLTVLSELRCLCAACHRAEHRRIALNGSSPDVPSV